MRIPSSSAGATSVGLSPTIAHRARSAHGAAASADRNMPVPGLRQSQVPSSCGHTSIRSRWALAAASSSSRRAVTEVHCDHVRRRVASPRWFVTRTTRHPARLRAATADAAPGRSSSRSASSTYPSTRTFSVPSRSRKTMSQGAPGAGGAISAGRPMPRPRPRTRRATTAGAPPGPGACSCSAPAARGPPARQAPGPRR